MVRALLLVLMLIKLLTGASASSADIDHIDHLLPCADDLNNCLHYDSSSGRTLTVWGGPSNGPSPLVPSSRSFSSSPLHFGIKVSLSGLLPSNVNCPSCPPFAIFPLDEHPRIVARRLRLHLSVLLGGFLLESPSSDAETEPFESLVEEGQTFLLTKLFADLNAHLSSQGVNLKAVEGNVQFFLGKMRLLRRLILSLPSVSSSFAPSVCEVGFNAGHSSLLWLSAGASRVVSFDLGAHPYGHVSHAYLSDLYPSRLHVVLGDSARTVPAFAHMFPERALCDVVFVDGGHLEAQAAADFRAFRAIVVASSQQQQMHQRVHWLVADDTHGEAGDAWRSAVSRGEVEDLGGVDGEYCEEMLSPFDERMIWYGGKMTEITTTPILKSDMRFGRYA